ncbi:hypothetical protein MSG28_000633 [Choristoneura fumiferana]|uniref:Uncharacterized protein n=2 Tax=Choristoneura fumiferana TaxID=7141 RepID=A0ACC0K1K7_CHOFU|nr:hypothetical protein MSG28_000633 [Choristoneura fumiferana]
MKYRAGFVAVTVLLVIHAYAERLTEKQEQNVIKYIEYEINRFDVHDENTLNKCLLKISELLKPYMKYGLKAWNVPVLDPLFLKTVKVSQNGNDNNFKADFHSVWVYGLSEYTIEYMRSQPSKYSFDLKLKFPDLKLLGQYDIDGKVLFLELKDQGPFTANLTNVDATVENKFTVKDGHLVLSETKTNFSFKSMKFHLENLLKGSPVGKSINEMLNKNVDDLMQDLKPAFSKEISRIIVRTLNKSVERLPLAKWEAAISR